jgi:hypothetical protein
MNELLHRHAELLRPHYDRQFERIAEAEVVLVPGDGRLTSEWRIKVRPMEIIEQLETAVRELSVAITSPDF